MKNFKMALIFSVLVTLLLNQACSPKPEQQTGASVQTTRVTATKKTLKPGAPIALVDSHPIQLNANQQTPINLRVKVEQKGQLRMNLSTSDGLQLTSTPTSQTWNVTTAEIELPLILNAPLEGRFYLHINALLQTEDGVSSRNLAIVVQVGQADPKRLKSSVDALPAGTDTVESMPAQETIKP